MRAIDRTTEQFLASIKDAIPHAQLSVDRSTTSFGRSNYIHIRDADGLKYRKVRISDHPVGMRRATSGQEHHYISAGARPASWAVLIGELHCVFKRQSA